MSETTFTLEEALERVPAEFPRPHLTKHYHESRFYNIILRELAADIGLNLTKHSDDLSLALAEQGVFPAWIFDLENDQRKRKIDRRHRVLMPGESLRYIKWLRQTRKELKSDGAKAA